MRGGGGSCAGASRGALTRGPLFVGARTKNKTTKNKASSLLFSVLCSLFSLLDGPWMPRTPSAGAGRGWLASPSRQANCRLWIAVSQSAIYNEEGSAV